MDHVENVIQLEKQTNIVQQFVRQDCPSRIVVYLDFSVLVIMMFAYLDL